ncbi:hypothetical protein RQP46_007980 [Phenoliferia psychrophenolica]
MALPSQTIGTKPRESKEVEASKDETSTPPPKSSTEVITKPADHPSSLASTLKHDEDISRHEIEFKEANLRCDLWKQDTYDPKKPRSSPILQPSTRPLFFQLPYTPSPPLNPARSFLIPTTTRTYKVGADTYTIPSSPGDLEAPYILPICYDMDGTSALQPLDEAASRVAAMKAGSVVVASDWHNGTNRPYLPVNYRYQAGTTRVILASKKGGEEASARQAFVRAWMGRIPEIQQSVDWWLVRTGLGLPIPWGR